MSDNSESDSEESTTASELTRRGALAAAGLAGLGLASTGTASASDGSLHVDGSNAMEADLDMGDGSNSINDIDNVRAASNYASFTSSGTGDGHLQFYDREAGSHMFRAFEGEPDKPGRIEFQSPIMGADESDVGTAPNGTRDLVIKETAVADRLRTKELPHADVTAYGAEGDGQTDDTAAIQDAIDAIGESGGSGTVYFPPGTYMVDPTRTTSPSSPAALTLHSDMELRFDSGATLKNLPHDAESYEMLSLYDLENVDIVGGTLDGARADNAATDGEWGMCIEIRHSQNVTVTGTTCKNAWGDGIYVGGRDATLPNNRNIVLERIHADGNRRQGISLVSARDFWLRDSLLENTSGTAPEAGLDIESHVSEENVDNINVSNLHTADNHSGIQIWLDGYEQPTPQNETKISIDRHYDRGSTNGVRLGTPSENIPGEVRLSNCRWEKSGKNAFNLRHWDTLRLIVDDCTAIDTLGDEAFLFRAWGHVDRTGGSIEINRPRVTAGEDGAKPDNAVLCGVNCEWRDFTFRNPKELAATKGQFAWRPTLAPVEDFTFIDENEVLRGSPDRDRRVRYWYTLSTIDSSEFTADRELYLPADPAPHGDYVFESHSDTHKMIVVPPSDEAIYPFSGSTGTSIESGGKGARLRLRKVATGTWMAINQIGTWQEGADVPHPDD